MKNPDNDNDEFSFITLGAATLNVMRFLEGSKDHQEQSERDTSRQRTEEEKAEAHRRAIDQGLRDIAAFEQRASGKTVRVRRK